MRSWWFLLCAGCAAPVALFDGFEATLTRSAPCGEVAYAAVDVDETLRVQIVLPSGAASFPIADEADGYLRAYTGHKLVAASEDLCDDVAGDARPRIDYAYDAIGGAAEVVGPAGEQEIAVQGLVLRAGADSTEEGWEDLDDVRVGDFTFGQLGP